MRCSATTKKGTACPIDADRFNDGKPVCHVHDKTGIFQLQVQASREDRAERKADLKRRKIQARKAAVSEALRRLPSNPPMTQAEKWKAARLAAKTLK